MSSEQDLDKLTEELFDASRGEVPTPEVKARILDEVLAQKKAGGPGGSGWWKKWLAGGLLLLGAGVSVGVLSQRGETSGEQPVFTAQPPLGFVKVLAPVAAPPTDVLPSSPSEVFDAGLAPEPVAVSEKPLVVKAKSRTLEIEEPDSLARELAMLDQARRALPGNPAQSLSFLDDHRRQFSRGSLRIEADLLRVEALVKLGRRREAETLGAKLVGNDQTGPIGIQVKRLLSGGAP